MSTSTTKRARVPNLASRIRWSATIASVVVLGAVAVAAVATASSSKPRGAQSKIGTGATAIASLPTLRLAAAGITLTPPSDQETAVATISEKVATGAADHGLPSAVLGAAIEHVRDTHLNPPLDQAAWVVSLSPSLARGDGPPGANPAPASFDVVVVSDSDGSVIEELSGSAG